MADMSWTLVDDMCAGLSKESLFPHFALSLVKGMNGWLDGRV